MDDIYLNRLRAVETPFWSPTGKTAAELAEEREKNRPYIGWIERTAKATDERPIHDGGNLSHGVKL